MANTLTHLTLPDNTTYDVHPGIYRGTVNSTSTNTAFTATIDGITTLFDGLTISLFNGTVASAANCTLDVNELGAKRIWTSQSNTYCTTHWAKNTAYLFVYDLTNDRWELQQGRDTDGNDTSTVRPYYSHPTTGGNGVKQYSLFARLLDGTYSSFTTNSGTGTKTFDSTNYFNPREIFYYYGSGDIAVNTVLGNNTMTYSVNLFDVRYNFNGVTTKASTSSIVANKPLYLVWDKASENKGCFKLKSPYYTQTPNDTNALYTLVGWVYDAYRCDLVVTNPVFAYDRTDFIPYSGGDASTVNGHTVATDVPSGAVFTDHYAWSDITGKPSSFTPASHTHGNIQNGGTLQTSDVTIANGDKLVITDSSDSSKVARSSVSFDGSTTTKCLTQKGTWETFGTSNLAIGTTATTALAGNTKYAGASTAGGSATSAAKLDTSTAGSATQPCYFANGVPSACTYSLNKTVPSDAVFTDTTYSSKAAASGGTDVSLVTTGEKYTWNNKANSAHTHYVTDILWARSTYLTCTTDIDNGDWRTILDSGTKTGCYWNLWSKKNTKSIIKADNDSCNVTIGSELITGTGIELGMGSNDSLSFIDFHWGSTNTDWTARIVQRGENTVDLIGKNSSTWGVWRAASFSSQSSIHVKENVQSITAEDARKLLQLRPVTFNYKNGGQVDQAGLIAEEVNLVMPKMVIGDINFNPEEPWNAPSIDYSKFVPYLIKMIQIQQKEIDKLKGGDDV